MSRCCELLDTVAKLAQQMTWLEQIAYREWTPRKQETGSHQSMSHAPVALDIPAWDMLQACAEALADMWAESGHITSNGWKALIENIRDDAEYITECTRIDIWIQALQELTARASKLTDNVQGLDQQGVLVATASELADYLATGFQLSCSAENARNLLRRERVNCKKLGNGYWAISKTSISQYAKERKPNNL